MYHSSRILIFVLLFVRGNSTRSKTEKPVQYTEQATLATLKMVQMVIYFNILIPRFLVFLYNLLQILYKNY